MSDHNTLGTSIVISLMAVGLVRLSDVHKSVLLTQKSSNKDSCACHIHVTSIYCTLSSCVPPTACVEVFVTVLHIELVGVLINM